MRERLVRFWYRRSRLAYLAAPLALPTLIFYYIRGALYRLGLLRARRLQVPVVIIGNIVAGGTGKTPLVIWLAEALADAGRTPGIVCRSYLAQATSAAEVLGSEDPHVYGDEALLLACRVSCPVWSGPDRGATAHALLRACPDLDVIVCDDGLQHYALARDCEIAVIDAARGFGNGLLLPAGPLREPVSRLKSVHAIVSNGGNETSYDANVGKQFTMQLRGETFNNLVEPLRSVQAEYFTGRRIAAIAGIGNPQRFFDTLHGLGIQFTAYPFADHHAYCAGDLRSLDAEVILMTEKDAIKCAAFADERMWVLPVSAVVSDSLIELVLTRIRKGRPAHD